MGSRVFQDHALSLLIGGGVLVLLLGVVTRTQEANVDTALRYDASQKSYGLVELIERDLMNIGVDGPAQPAILAFDWAAATPTFEFVTLGDTTAAAPSAQVRYALETVSAADCLGDADPCYRFVRSVHDGTAYRPDYVSPPSITGLTLSPTPLTGDLDDIRTLAVKLHMEAPNTDTPITWDRLLSPPNLAYR
ncbi:MAG: hypothetical protein AAGG50_08290 [Bacteroidota bacterium]